MGLIRCLSLILAVIFVLGILLKVAGAQEPPPPIPPPDEPTEIVQLWSGATSQGWPLTFSIVTNLATGEQVVTDWGTTFTLTCGKTNTVFIIGQGFFGFDLPPQNFSFNFSPFPPQWAFSFEGSVTGTVATGFISSVWAIVDSLFLTAYPGSFSKTFYLSENCQSGNLTWFATPTDEIVPPPPPPPTGKGAPQHSSEVWRNLDGKITIITE